MQTWVSKDNFIRTCVKLFGVYELTIISVHATVKAPFRAKIKVSMIWYANIDYALTIAFSSTLNVAIEHPYGVSQVFNTPWHTIISCSHTEEICIWNPWCHYTSLYSFTISIYETCCGISKTSIWISWESATLYAELHITAMISDARKIILEQSKLAWRKSMIIDTWELHTE